MNKLFSILFFLIVFQFYGQPNDRFTIKSVSINTENNEFGTVVSNAQIVYYLKSNFNNQKDLNELSSNLYRGEIIGGNNISKGLKFPTDAIHAVFTNDGKTVYYSKKEGDKLQLFKASVDNTGRWKNPVKLSFNSPKFNYKQPSLNRDHTKLFFVSDKSDAVGGTDIFYVNITNNGLSFSEPIQLGFYVNSPGDEIFPFVGDKDKLYFSSNGMNGLGGFDIFESFYVDGKYENTANLGEPINSNFDEIGYTLISNNYNGFLASNRTGGSGGFDIYSFSDKKPTLNNCAKSIKGFVRNKETKKPIFEAIVEIFDSKGNNENTLTDAEGAFVISNVECETTYDIVSYKEGYNGFAEVHTSPMDDEIINLYLNPEFPEGFKEEFDFSNEITVIETKASKESKKDVAKVENSNQIVTKKEPVAVIDKDREKIVQEAKKTAEDLKKNPDKDIADNYDPLDYDPKTQPKKVVNNETKKGTESQVVKKEVVAKEWDPLDYDPKTQPKTKTITNPVEEKKTTETKKEVVENTDYDPLDYDPHTQYLEDLKKKKDNAKNIEEARIKREAAEKERQQAIAEAKAYSEQLKKEEEAKALASAEKAKTERDAADNDIALQNQEKAKLEAEKQNAFAAQKAALEKERQQAIAEAKAYSEQLKKEEEAKALASAEKAKTERDAADKDIALQNQEKAKLEAEKQNTIAAQKAALEKERQQAIAEAKVYSEQLKKEEDAKSLTATEKAKVEKTTVEKKVELVNPEKNKYYTVQKGDGLYSIAKNNNLSVEELKAINKLTTNSINVGQKLLVVKPAITVSENTAIALVENQEKAKQEVEKQNTLAEQKTAQEKERQQAISEAKAYSEQLKKEEEAKALAIAEKAKAEKEAADKATALQNQEKAKQEAEKQNTIAAQKAALEKERQQAITEAKAYSEQLKKEQEVKALATTEQVKTEQKVVEKIKVETVNSAKEQYYTVQKGDGLYSIAKNNNLTVEELKAINKLTNNSINVGQKLLVVKPAITVSENTAIAQIENKEKTKQEAEKQNVNAAQKAALEKERQQAIAEAKANSEKLKKEEEAKALAAAEKAKIEQAKNIVAEEFKYDESKSEQENLAAKIEANRILKKEAEEKARLDRIEKAKATALRLKQEKEQNELAETSSVKNKGEFDQNTEEADNGICSKNINGFVKNSLTKRNIANVKIDIYYEGQNIETASTNASGEFFFYNVDCDTKYTLICYKEGFDNIAKAVLDTKYDQKNITILLEPNSDKAITANVQTTEKKIIPVTPVETEGKKQEITQKVLTKDELEMSYEVEPEVIEAPKIKEGRIVLNPIYFDLDEYYLTLPARRELDRIILFMKLNPTMIIESGSHTDTQGSFDYNLALSERRSQETVGYLIANGADPDRISGRGYGETMPMNHCLDGVKCSEKEHLQNRRTEFVILKY